MQCGPAMQWYNLFCFTSCVCPQEGSTAYKVVRIPSEKIADCESVQALVMSCC